MTTEPENLESPEKSLENLESLSVLYQSDDFIVVDKHWDVRIDSKMWYEKHTVQAQLRHRFPQLADPSTYYGFRSESHCYLNQLVDIVPIEHYSLIIFLLCPPGSVISWISPPVGLFVLP